MEPARAWEHCTFQRAQWTAEELAAADEVWAPAAGLPVEYASIDILPSSVWSLRPYVPSSPSGVVEYYYYAEATQYDGPIVEKAKAAAAAAQESFEVVNLLHDMDMEIYNNNAIGVFEEAGRKFKDDIDMMKKKIHRYPSSIGDTGKSFTVPRIVSIGPYHHGKKKLNKAENVKHAAAFQCIELSGRLVQEMYHAVISVMVKTDARRLYDKEVMECFDDINEFQPMMFYDACFLVMYMLLRTSSNADYNGLRDFFESNDRDITHDIMLLENQIPWPVVEAIIKYTSVPLEKFISIWKDDFLLDRVVEEVPLISWDDNYKPPHLLGLLRFYIVRTTRSKAKVPGLENMKSITFSVSAIELTEMGISLAANETEGLADSMELTKEWFYSGKLSMAPLSLNYSRASLLVNMAAHELCTVPYFLDNKATDEDSAVCSYLLLLCMLMQKENDVEHLRTSGILKGGAGLTDKQALDFFTSLQSLRLGRCCSRVMVEIESYKNSRWMQIKVYGFISNNWKTILGVSSAIGALISILAALKSLGSHAQ